MSVTLREKKLENGKLSLYLDYYPAIKKSDGKFTRREFLGIHVLPRPKTETEKMTNEAAWAKAREICALRQQELIFKKMGMYNPLNAKVDFLKFFLDEAEKRRAEKNTYGNWKSAYKKFVEFTGGRCTMGEVDNKLCSAFRDFLVSLTIKGQDGKIKLSQNSASSYFIKFGSVVKAAFDKELLPKNPLKGIEFIKQISTKREFLTWEEIKKLVDTPCRNPVLKTACLFGSLTGLRWSDVKRLKWSDIQHSVDYGYFIHITIKKTKSPVVHPLSPEAIKLLGPIQKSDEDVFKKLKYSMYNNGLIQKWVSDAGIKKEITFHNFRHSLATNLLNSGTSLATIKNLLNHRHIGTTLIYAKVSDSTKRDAVNSIQIFND